MPRSPVAGFALAGLALVVSALAAFGFSTRHARLNFGPGDTPFVAGFQGDADVEEKVGWRWTTYDAAIALPIEGRGSDLELTLRYARVFGEEAVVDISVGGVPVETFMARGGEVRSRTVRASRVSGPLKVGIRVDSHERRNMGLKMDTMTIDATGGEALRLERWAALRPVISVGLVFLGLFLLGTSSAIAGSAALVSALAFAARASSDLFDAWRQTELLPAMLIVSTILLAGCKRGVVGRGLLEKGTATALCAASLVAIALRLTLISHPDFYYPDLLTHTRVVEAIRTQGPSFFLDPAEALREQGAWTKPVLGSVSSLPYAVMLHAPMAPIAALFDLTTDQVETLLKAVSCIVSALPILLSGILAAQLSLPPLSAIALVAIPTYASRLSLALMPALFGHVFDLVVLLAVAFALGGAVQSWDTRARVLGALLLGHLAYTSSVVNEGVFIVILIALLAISGKEERRAAFGLVVLESLAALTAFTLYYRHFMGDVSGLLLRITGLGTGGVGGSASVYPVESFWSVLFERTNAFFGASYVILAVAGLGLAGPKARASRVIQAWGLTYLMLILLRAKVPDVFRYGHETLFLTPLVGILAGTAAILAARRGGALRLTALVVGAGVAAASLWQQWEAIAAQLGNAR